MNFKQFGMCQTLTSIIIFIVMLFTFSTAIYAHPGGTDSAGGHYNHRTGEYHYHHGKPAHQHVNGICPYDNSAKVSSIVESTASASTKLITTQDTTPKKSISSDSANHGSFVFSSLITAGAFAFLIFGGMWLAEIHAENKQKISDATINSKATRGMSPEKTHPQLLSPTEIKALHTRITVLTENNQMLQEQLVALESENSKLSEQIAVLSGQLNDYKQRTIINANQPPSIYEDILKEAGVPFGVSFDSEALPHYYLNDAVEQNFHVYISNGGKHYHRRFNCSGATIPVHLFRVADNYCPCQKCIPYKAWNYRIPAWYYNYLNLLQKYFNEHKITQPDCIRYQLEDPTQDLDGEETADQLI